MKKLLTLFLTVCYAVSLLSCTNRTKEEPDGTSGDSTASPSRTDAPAQKPAPLTDQERMLRVGKDGYLYNGLGQEVVLGGINLGGWLLQETWMCPVVGSECNLDSLHLLESRGFTQEQIATLYQSYADNYITEKDIRNIANMNMNCIRVPFWYRNFMDDGLQFYTEDPDQNPGFVLLDRVIAWAEKYDLYVILDLHGAPGGQSTDHCCGTLNKNELYTVEANLEATQRLWVAIAERYRHSGTVCAYDLLNEPMNNGNSQAENAWPAGSPTAIEYTHTVYDRLYHAVRAVDPDHMISMEGIWSTDCLPDPIEKGYTNLLYQLHLYDSTAEMLAWRVAELTQIRKDWKVAIYVGEFNNGDQLYEKALKLYTDNKISCTAWTYKVSYDHWGNWSVYRADILPADLANDSYGMILSKWGKNLQTNASGWSVNTTLKKWLTQAFR